MAVLNKIVRIVDSVSDECTIFRFKSDASLENSLYTHLACAIWSKTDFWEMNISFKYTIAKCLPTETVITSIVLCKVPETIFSSNGIFVDFYKV